MRVSDVLAAKPARLVTLPPTASAAAAARLMQRERVGAILICDAQRQLLGILSERDLALAIAEYGPTLSEQAVEELMSAGGPVLSVDDPVRAAMQVMTERRARHLPVLDKGEVIGLVSIGDLLKSRLAEKTQETAVLQDLARAHMITPDLTLASWA